MKDKNPAGYKKKPSSTMGCRAGEESEYGPAEREEGEGRQSQLVGGDWIKARSDTSRSIDPTFGFQATNVDN